MTRKPLPALPHEVEHWGEVERTDFHRFVAMAALGAIGVAADLAGLLPHGFALELAVFGFAVCAFFGYRWRAARWRRQTALDDLILGAWSGAVPEPDEADCAATARRSSASPTCWTARSRCAARG